MPTRRLLILTAAVIALSAIAHLALATDQPLLAHAAAALLAAIILPGLLLADLLLGPAHTPRQWLLLALSGVGAGCGVAILAMLLLSYLPGGVSRSQALSLFDAILLCLLLIQWLSRRRTAVFAPDEEDGDPRWLWLSIALALLIAAGLRLAALGYSEFQGDEARVMLRASEMLTGYENALMVHQKGPGEILLPAALYALMGHMNETAARLPFALANIAGVIGGLLLGRRLFGATAGVFAALLLVLNGYLLAFGRIVQYQSVIFLLTVLVVLLLYEGLDEAANMRRVSPRRLALVAFLTATGLLAHYEMAAVAIPALFLLWRLWRAGAPLKKLSLALLAPLIVGLVVAGAFYLPYLLHPAFAAAYSYVFGYRMGGGSFPHNNLLDFFQRSSLYNSSYYLFLLIFITLGFLLAIYRRHLPGVVVALIGAGLLAGLAYTFYSSSWLWLRESDHTWLFFSLPIIAVWLLPRVSLEERLVFLWFGALMIFSLFVVARPNSHVYTFFIPWALLAGGGLQLAHKFLGRHWGTTRVNALLGAVGLLLVLLFGNYLYRLFVHNGVETLRTWGENRPAGYWQPFAEPPDVAIFGFPLRNGWKAVGVGYARGELEGMFETNAKPEVVDWYTRGAGVCPRNDRYYFLADTVETSDDERLAELERGVANEYPLAGWVTVQGAPRLRLYDRQATGEPDTIAVEQIEAEFDRTLSQAEFTARRGKVVNPQIAHPLEVRLGDNIALVGYNLEETEAAPGETLRLRLYWRVLGQVDRPLSIFTQVIDLTTAAKVGQRDGMPVCDRSLTNTWNVGDLIEDSFEIDLTPDATPSDYRLIVGMYDPESGQRLPVSDALGQSLGDFVDLTLIRVKG